MPFSFRKSKKIFPGTRLNISKRGISSSFGFGGIRFNTGKYGCGCFNFIIIVFMLLCLLVWVQNVLK